MGKKKQGKDDKDGKSGKSGKPGKQGKALRIAIAPSVDGARVKEARRVDLVEQWLGLLTGWNLPERIAGMRAVQCNRRDLNAAHGDGGSLGLFRDGECHGDADP